MISAFHPSSIDNKLLVLVDNFFGELLDTLKQEYTY